jgi:hypothetical protein
MIRRTISLVLALTLAVLLVAPSVVQSGNGNGDVDPTGLDTGHRISSAVRDPGTPVVGLRDVSKTSPVVARWLEMFYLRVVLRSLGF